MNNSVCVMGMGYVGLTLSVVLAECGYEVTGIETNGDIVNKLNKGIPNFHEEGLVPRLTQQLSSGKLQIVTDIPGKFYDVYIISVGTPLLSGKKTPNLNYIDKVLEDVGNHLKKGALVCMRSTIPVGLTRSKVIPTLETKSGLKAGKDFHVAFTPERTIEGNALLELKENPQIIGALTLECADKAATFFLKITPTLLRVSSLETAELCKITDNTYRDIRFAYANEMALIAEQLGLDMGEVIRACNTHYPRNHIPFPSPGVGGACLSKDPHILISFSDIAGYHPKLIAESREINEKMTAHMVQRIEKTLQKKGKKLSEVTVTIAGFAFKGNPETSDLRDSTTLWLLRDLKLAANCKVKGFDPVIPASVLAKYEIEAFDNIEAALKESDVLIIANNHRSYKNWDISKMILTMKKPAIIFDAWRMLDKTFVDTLKDVTYLGVGV